MNNTTAHDEWRESRTRLSFYEWMQRYHKDGFQWPQQPKDRAPEFS